MGRCYEFGVGINDSCEHAMSVTLTGGACECTVCGAHCPGRFAGCAQVVDKPGHVPALAPSWARSGDAAGPPRPELSRPLGPGAWAPAPLLTGGNGDPRPIGGVEAELAAIRELVEKLLERPDGADLLSFGTGLAARDAELSEAFDRFVEGQRRLSTEMRDTRDTQIQLADLLGRVDRRLATLEEAIGSRSGIADWLRKLG